MSPSTVNVVHPQIDASIAHIPFKNTITFYLNGTKRTLTDPDPEGPLIDYIRQKEFLTGTKLGCSEGGCGACSITVAHYDPVKKMVQYQALNSCIVPLIAVDGKHLITVEGIGSTENLHPVQERIALMHGSQCGFCTPGIVMSLYSLLRKNPNPSKEQISEALDGNLCRCTGYMPIIDAANFFACDNEKLQGKVKERPNGCAMGDNCCRNKKPKLNEEKKNGAVCSKGDQCYKNKSSNETNSTEFPESETDINALFTPNGLPLKPYKPEEDLVFPTELTTLENSPVFFGNDKKLWIKPTTKKQLLEVVNAYPGCKLVGGASEVQIEIKMKNMNYRKSVYCNDIPELKILNFVDGKGLQIGANTSLSDIEYKCEELAEQLGKRGQGQVFETLSHQLKYFAGRQIRNAATPAGAIVTASPISDLNPILMACNAVLIAEALDEPELEFPLKEFFIGYRKTKLPSHYTITKIFVPITQKLEYIQAFKQSKRKDDDIAIVTSCLRISLNDDLTVKDSCLAYGGMAPMTVCSKLAEESLVGKLITDPTTLKSGIDALSQDYPLSYGVPGGMATYRRTLTLSFFYKFYQYVLSTLVLTDTKSIDSVDEDSLAHVTRNKPKGHRDLQTPFEMKVVGKSNPHLSALKQVSGEAVYTDDMPPQHNEVFGVQVMSTKARAKILSIDYSKALEVESVIGYIDINDLPDPHANLWGVNPVGMEQFFADGEVFTVGQTISVIFATSRERAAEAVALVKIEYEDMVPVISIEDAIEADSFFDDDRLTEKGDWEKAFSDSKYVLEGSCRFGAQEHFYFETQGCLVVPEEGGELKIYSSTQNPTETQEWAAHVTGVPSSRVVVRVKRLGGGFGGKETRSVPISSLASIGAKKFKRPVRIILTRFEDMLVSGQRHPFLMKWKVGLDENYKFTGLDSTLYANAGWSMDISRGVVDRAVFHAANAYHIPNARVLGRPCKTNTASNTAFRGFGGPQGMYMAECMVQDIAEKLDIDPEFLRDANYYDSKAGQTSTYKQAIGVDYVVPDLAKQNKEEAKYDDLVRDVKKFNESHKWIKRGVSHIPTMFGISFGVLFLNQAGALVHIYNDGSILVSHGGTEMGQGLNTKMCMIVAEELGVSLEEVFISETSTQVVINTSATAASASSDLNGMAVKNACDQLNERLQPYRIAMGPNATMKEIAKTAYLDRVNLSANGFYKTPEIGYEWGAPNPKPAFFYYTQGSAISVVEVDTLTGDWTCLESHIKMDIGRPINQAIDYGQIEGAFMQGMGLFTMEQSLWFRNNGGLFTRGPGNYKIPGFRDVPQYFSISMLKDRDFSHLKTIRRSKGIGEPPLFLGCSVQFAIRDALNYARKEHGVAEGIKGCAFNSPLTTERIRNLVGDELVAKGLVEPKENEKEFFIEA